MRRVVLLIVGLIFFSSAGIAQTQDDSPPLIVVGAPEKYSRDMVIYRVVDDIWQEVSTIDDAQDNVWKIWGTSASPDGEWLAYQYEPFIREGDAVPPIREISLLNLRDGHKRAVTHSEVNRSVPIWSPDSHMIAWMEIDWDFELGEERARLMIYDLASQTTRMIDDAIPLMWLSSEMPNVFSWGSEWISIFANDPDDYTPLIRLYNPSTGEKKEIRIIVDEGYEWWPWSGLLWVMQGNGDAAHEEIVFPVGYTWHALDPLTEELTVLNSCLEMVGAQSPTDSMRVVWDMQARTDDKDDIGVWQMLTSEGAELAAGHLTFFERMDQQFVLSPNGDQVIRSADRTLTRWTHAQRAEIPLPETFYLQAVFWGPSQWQASGERRTCDHTPITKIHTLKGGFFISKEIKL